MPIVSIALEKLRVSPHNVRKSQNKITFEELKASVKAHGLLQPPLVTEADDGHYEVVDGGRRLAVLQALQKEGFLPKGHSVDCSTAGKSDTSELSLAANVMRDAMHPADEFEAYAALSKDHKPADIAARFGVTEKHVLQRLKLGKLAPEILKAYREQKLDLEALMAYTLTDDQNAQRKVFKAQNGHHHAHSIKRLLTENKVQAGGKIARFVGLAAYEKAGGKITANLFRDEQYLDDATLLQQLATETAQGSPAMTDIAKAMHSGEIKVFNGEDEGSPTERVAWRILQALHSNVPEDQRPMSWSDMSPEQQTRIRQAADDAIEETMLINSTLTPPKRELSTAQICEQNKDHWLLCRIATVIATNQNDQGGFDRIDHLLTEGGYLAKSDKV